MTQKETFNPNDTFVGKITSKSSFKPMALAGLIGTVGACIIGLNAILGINIRPVFAFEVEKLVASDTQQIVATQKTMKRLETLIRAQDASTRTILALQKGQYDLKLRQIDRQKRELRRELAEHQSRAQVFRDKGERVPGWIRGTIADTETTLDELQGERRRVEDQQLELER
jgi:hypothetical protein